MRYVFYITNHGFGHASRNVPIIKRILNIDIGNKIYIKTDKIRCEFLKRNLRIYDSHIFYYDDCKETGLIMNREKMKPDIPEMKQAIKEDFAYWDTYIAREVKFLQENQIDVVISDVIPWAVKAAKISNIPSILIGNFTWSQMYKSLFGEEIWEPYEKYYQLADKAVWYEIHADELHQLCEDYECVSMVSRDIDMAEVEKIKKEFSKEIVFVSLGASAEMVKPVCVEGVEYEFLVTRGVKMAGSNVHVLPEDMINTPDYIAASDYVIAKGGWSTVAEILLQRKKCALLFRGENSEDNNTRSVLERRGQCVGLNGDELSDIQTLIDKIKKLRPDSYDMYREESERISRIIIDMPHNKNRCSK